MPSPQARIARLLERLQIDFPRQKAALEAQLAEVGIHEPVTLKFGKPGLSAPIPTFGRVARPATPMLAARYAAAGAIDYVGESWLAPRQMRSQMRRREVRDYHAALREHWEGSAPMRFADDRLSLYSIYDDVPDALTYLVWARDRTEPEIWSYSGMQERKFKNLATFLQSHLKRD